jgi:putative spermidine/putrescine transport system substrate-binding protein
VRARHAMAAAAAVTGSLLLTVGCSSSGSSSGSTSSNTASGTNWATAASAAAGGGMNALVAAAKKEGTLNVITLPANWANYGTIMKDFTASRRAARKLVTSDLTESWLRASSGHDRHAAV